MKILINISSLSPPLSGVGRYTQELISHLLKNPEIEDIINKNTVDPSKTVEPPETALVIIGSNGREIIFGTLGNISMIVGKGKAKKTFFTVACTAAALGNKITLGNIKGKLPDNKNNVLFFDTEQGNYHAHSTANRIFKLNNESAIPHFQYIKLRELDMAKKKDIINYMIEMNPQVGYVIIDGIRDLLSDINSPVEATEIKDWLLQISSKHNIHITVILHTNKTDNNARGHIGTELINKCETTVLIEKDSKNQDVSVAKFEYTRDKTPDDFAFSVDIDGLPYGCDVPQPNKKIQSEDLLEADHFNIIQTIFKDRKSRNATQLNNDTIQVIEELYEPIGKDKARQFIKYLVQNSFINENGTGNRKIYTAY